MFLILVVGLSLGVLISTHRKKAAGITWFPEGFLRTGSNNSRTSTQRRVPDGQELRTMKQNNMTLSCMDMNSGVMTIGRGAGAWSDEDAEGDMPPAKRHRPAPISSQPLDNPYDDVWSHCNLNSNDNKATVMYTPPSRVSFKEFLSYFKYLFLHGIYLFISFIGNRSERKTSWRID